MATYHDDGGIAGAVGDAAALVGGAGRRRSYALGLAGGSSHARAARGLAKSTKLARMGSEVALGAGAGSVQGNAAAAAAPVQGIVVQELTGANGEMLLHIVSPDGLSQVIPASSVRVVDRKPGGSGHRDAAEEGEWEAQPYSPADSFFTSVSMMILGGLCRRRRPGVRGGEAKDSTYNPNIWEYKRDWNYLHILLVFVPVVFIFNYASVGDTPTFICSFLAIIPLAGLLGHFTEDLSCHVGSALGALLNASFGNATEIIICVFAVKEQLFDVIKNSMLGSVMSNMLLVLGCAFIARSVPNGTEERAQELKRSALWTFNAESANVFASLLLLSTFCIVVPTAYAQLHILPHAEEGVRAARAAGDAPPGDGGEEEGVSPQQLYDASRGTAVVMIVLYCIFLYFQVKNNEVFDGSGAKEDGEDSDGDDEEEEAKMSKAMDIGGLAAITVLIAFVSEFLVGALESATESLGLNEAWVAVILIPIVGNAAEHATAVVSAYKGDMECAVGVAIGSSIQIAGFAVPLLVIVSWVVNGPNPAPLVKDGVMKQGGLDMNFHPFSMTLMTLSVVVVNTVLTDGKGSWLEGVCLLASYTVLAVVFWYVPKESDA